MGNSICKKSEKNKEKMKLFETQVHLIYKELYKFIFCIAGNSPMAEDILQNTLEKAYIRLPTLKDDLKFKSWVFSIAKNEALSYLRRNRREFLFETFDNTNDPTSVEVVLPDEYMINKEIKNHIISVINNLKPEYKRVVILRYYAGLSMREISQIMGVNINTIKTRHKRIKSIIYNDLMDKGYMNDRFKGSIKGGRVNEKG